MGRSNDAWGTSTVSLNNNFVRQHTIGPQAVAVWLPPLAPGGHHGVPAAPGRGCMATPESEVIPAQWVNIFVGAALCRGYRREEICAARRLGVACTLGAAR